ncbi:MAG: hypothetical protein Q8O04_12575 [Deltaproteobacteria bacterium]|nr:hypothetical protein [Deltaproteobacteria bacterium]
MKKIVAYILCLSMFLMPTLAMSKTSEDSSLAFTEQRMISDEDMRALFGEDAITEGSQPIQVAMLTDAEMKETEGAVVWPVVYGAVLVGSRVVMATAPLLSKWGYRVVNSNTHQCLLKNGRHLLQIGTDKFGQHIAWGAGKLNHAAKHIYQNAPWKINPR